MASGSDERDYPVADRIDLTLDAREDRLILGLALRSDEPRAAWLTRRILRRLLEAYTSRLRRTSTTAAHAPATQRDEVLQMEHASAIAARRDRAAEPGDADTGDGGPCATPDCLVTQVHLRNRGSSLVLALDGVAYPSSGPSRGDIGPIGAVLLDRAQAHQFLAMLRAKGREAEWDLPEAPAWTGRIRQPGAATN